MAWVAKDSGTYGSELRFINKPVRDEKNGVWFSKGEPQWSNYLPSGSIKKLIGRELTWEDEPVEI